MSAFTALLSAMAYGVGDFYGGVATRRSGSVVPVIVVSHAVGLGVVAILLLLIPGEMTAKAMVAGSLGGIAGALGFAMLYRGLAVGRMAVVAPVTALLSGALPVVWGLASGERPGGFALTGAALGLVAVPLVARVETDPDAGAGALGVREAVGAGIAFAIFFVALDAAGDASGVVPLLAARLTSIPLFVGAAVLLSQPLVVRSPALLPALAAGVLDMSANGLFLASTRLGYLTVTAVLVSLYPAATIVLARLVLHERIGSTQRAGLGLAAVGVVLMAAG